MKQKDLINLKIDEDNNLILIMKITAIKPLIETLKKYKNEDIAEDIEDIIDINEYYQNLLIKNNPNILKNLINEIIEVYEDEFYGIVENKKYGVKEKLTTISSTDKTASDILDGIDLKYFDDIELIDINDMYSD